MAAIPQSGNNHKGTINKLIFEYVHAPELIETISANGPKIPLIINKVSSIFDFFNNNNIILKINNNMNNNNSLL